MSRLNTTPLYSLADISIIPSIVSTIKSRSECDPFQNSIGEGNTRFLPLISAPMSCIYQGGNEWKELVEEKINPVIPRTFDLQDRLELSKTLMTAFSLSETYDILREGDTGRKWYICIDMANGHMVEQIETGWELRKKFGDSLVLMGGNIANPLTFLKYEAAGFDYVRCGIGGGNSCLTSTQTAIHTPMASLLSEINEVKGNNSHTKVVADGGISGYSDIIKCLALGADYVMMGRIFTKAAFSGQEVGQEVPYYGMSTKKAQKEMGGKGNKTAEGREIKVTKEYTLSGWAENFRDYLRSAMSYTDSRSLSEFSQKSRCNVISPNSSYSINNK